MAQFEVIAGNVGTVYSGPSEQDAQSYWVQYVELSKQERGRVSGESVYLMRDGSLIEEYIGPQDREEWDGFSRIDPQEVYTDDSPSD